MPSKALRPPETRGLLITAQILVLVAMAFGVQFLMNTTGGTLFLFATIGPALMGLAVVILAGVLIYHYRRRQSLFEAANFAPDEIIFRQGDDGDCAYFIQRGKVEVFREENEKEIVIATLGEGEYFGEMALLRNAQRNASVRAKTATRVSVLGKSNFLTLLSALPSTNRDIMKTVQQRAMQATDK